MKQILSLTLILLLSLTSKGQGLSISLYTGIGGTLYNYKDYNKPRDLIRIVESKGVNGIFSKGGLISIDRGIYKAGIDITSTRHYAKITYSAKDYLGNYYYDKRTTFTSSDAGVLKLFLSRRLINKGVKVFAGVETGALMLLYFKGQDFNGIKNNTSILVGVNAHAEKSISDRLSLFVRGSFDLALPLSKHAKSSTGVMDVDKSFIYYFAGGLTINLANI